MRSDQTTFQTAIAPVALDGPTEDSSINCFVFEGLCNRINALVTASVAKRDVRLFWAVNKHCPVEFEELFWPIDRIDVRNVKANSFPYKIDANDHCWFYVVNPAGIDQADFVKRAKAGYRQLISKLRHRPDPKLILFPQQTAGISFRQFLPTGSAQPLSDFLIHAKKWLAMKSPSHVLVTSDSLVAKLCLAKFVEMLGYKSIVIDCKLLASDFDRSLGNLVGLSQELIGLSQCRRGILTNSVRSSIADSARGFDVVVDRTFDSGRDRRNYQIETLLNQVSIGNP